MEGLELVANGVGLVELINSGDDELIAVPGLDGVVGLLDFRALEHGFDVLMMSGKEGSDDDGDGDGEMRNC